MNNELTITDDNISPIDLCFYCAVGYNCEAHYFCKWENAVKWLIEDAKEYPEFNSFTEEQMHDNIKDKNEINDIWYITKCYFEDEDNI